MLPLHVTGLEINIGVQVGCAAPGLVERRAFPSWSTATHREVDGQEIAVNGVGSANGGWLTTVGGPQANCARATPASTASAAMDRAHRHTSTRADRVRARSPPPAAKRHA